MDRVIDFKEWDKKSTKILKKLLSILGFRKRKE